jgi:hypothetical protein
MDAVIGVVEQLGYKNRRIDVGAASVSFTSVGRDITVKIVDLPAGTSKIIIEYPTFKAGALAVGMIATAGYGALAWPALRIWERTFGRGFLDNVQGLLEGRGLVCEPGVPESVTRWWKGTRKV